MSDVREAVLQLDRAELSKLGLGDLFSVLTEAGVREVTDLVWQGDGGIVLVRVESRVPADRLDAVEAVVWTERLGESAAGVTYLCELSVPELPEQEAIARQVRGVDEEGVEVSIVGSQGDISRSVDALDDAGVEVLVERLADYRGPPTPLDALTDRQREVVRTAHELGYYEVPRAVSTEEVAARLDLEPSTVIEHLHRAERNLFDRLLAEE